MSKKSRSRTDGKRDPKTVAFWGFVAAAVVVGGGMYWASESRTPPAYAAPAYIPSAPPVSGAEPPVSQDAALQGVRDIVASRNPITVSVLGDSTGNGSDEWVALWAKDLSATKSVELHMWDKEVWSEKVAVMGSGPLVKIWNGSHPGAAARYATEKLDQIQPEKPDLTILSFGHNQTAADAAVEQQALIGAMALKYGGPVPVATVLQNAAGEPRAERSRANTDAIADWAKSVGVPAIDVRAEFVKLPDLKAFLVDDGLGVHPNPEGSRIWADVVSGQLNPR